MPEQLSLILGHVWIESADGDPSAMSLFRRHYTARKTMPLVYQFVGPGEKLVLMTADGRALIAWRKEQFRADGQIGVNCAVFRNEGPQLSSFLIREAVKSALHRWPRSRFFTFVDPAKIRNKAEPGKCFVKAGWSHCGVSKSGKLILELEAQVRAPEDGEEVT